MTKVRVFVMMVILVLIIPIIGACGDDDSGPGLEQGTYEKGPSFDPGGKIDTKTFASVEEYNTFIKQYHDGGDYYYDGRGANVMWAETMAVDEDFAMEGPMIAPMPAPGIDQGEASGGGTLNPV